jgi:hypothetical protein
MLRLKLIALTLLISVCAAQETFVCPPADLIVPCTCSLESNRPGNLDCDGPLVTQKVINDAVEATLLANNVSTSLSLTGLSITSTSLTTLDLSPFLGLHITFFQISGNKNLTVLTGPTPIDPSIQGQIGAFSFSLYDNKLVTDEGLGETLRYLSNSDIGVLYIDRCDVSGGHYPLGDGSGDVEFLPGLGSLTEVSFLSLEFNRIRGIQGGQFKRNHRLKDLFLGNNAGLKLGKDALLFNEADEADLTWPIYVSLTHNGLRSEDFSGENTIFQSDRAIQVTLGWNEIDSLPEEFFRPFVSTHFLTYVLLPDNPIVCDGRLKWYKDNLSEFQHRVQQCDCFNDPGKECFESTLIDE